MDKWQLNNVDIDDFLAHYWQQKPLFIPQALPGFSSLISPQELAGLACEEGVHSRLVIEKGAETPWQLRYGPFKENDFTGLPATHYSLLVSECEKWIPELKQLLELFSFIPKWRLDDLMISYAPEFGSVGPHIDEYDVFLIQASGQRHWSIENGQKHDPELIPGLDLAIMQHFNSDQEWLLEPGDMLYLPPKIAHHGVAAGVGCMTYSVGFRAPSVADIVDSFLLEASEHGLTDRRYVDLPLDKNRDPAEITEQDIMHFRAMVYKVLEESSPLWPNIVGKLLSDASLSPNVSSEECESLSDAAQYRWQKHPDTKIYYHLASNCLHIYCNGRVNTLEDSDSHRSFCHILCHEDTCSMADIEHRFDQSCQGLMLELIQHQAFVPIPEDD